MSKVYISEQADKRLTEYLREIGCEPVLVKSTPWVGEAVASHPDMYMCKIGASPSAPVFKGKAEALGKEYPNDILYNAVIVGEYFIHRLESTAKELMYIAKNMKKINVRQGYTKCNTVVVDDERIITSDGGIYKALAGTDIKVLKVEKEQVRLAGFDYGFLGGASGRVGNRIIFNGNLSIHSDFDRIKAFIEEAGLEVVFFKEYPLEDIGSIIEAAE